VRHGVPALHLRHLLGAAIKQGRHSDMVDQGDRRAFSVGAYVDDGRLFSNDFRNLVAARCSPRSDLRTARDSRRQGPLAERGVWSSPGP